MDQQLSKSVLASNTHQVVLDGDPRMIQAINFANQKLQQYGRRKPLNFAACCLTFLRYRGKNGYKAGHSDVISSWLMTENDRKLF